MPERECIRVVIAEDDFLVSQMLQSLLIQRGYDVVGRASDGIEAISMTRSLRPDVVIMDVQMPDMNGVEASRRIQETVPTPIVVLTAYERRDLVESAAEAGVGAYLVKPPNARELERAIIIARARFEDLRKLRELNQELSRVNEDLDAFSHTVAHDLKHFLGPILGFAEVLSDDYGKVSVKQARTHLGFIAQSARDMNNVIEGLLLLAHVRKGDVTLKPMEMKQAVDEALRRLEHMAEQYQVTIEQPPTWPVVMGHMSWVVEVWINYLSNAMKYGGDAPQIELGWQMVDHTDEVSPNAGEEDKDDVLAEAPEIEFWVRDRGPGISEERLARIFSSFSTPNQAQVRGHGLGLSIVKRIVDKLGGDVYVESEVGCGSKFGFTLKGLPEDWA